MWRAERDGMHPKLFFFVLVISSQGLRHDVEVSRGPIHKMALLSFQSPIQVFGELSQGRRERERDRAVLEREREGETHYQCQEQETREDSGESNPNPLQKPTKLPPPSARTREAGEHPSRGKNRRKKKPRETS